MGKARTIARRTFLVGSVAVTGGVAFSVWRVNTPFANPLLGDLKDGEAAITPFIKIDGSGVTLITPRADKGQGAYSIQTYLLAEELDVDPLKVKTSVGKPAKAYTNFALGEEIMPGRGHILGKLMPMQMTGGSSTVPDMYVRLRRAGAAARETLKEAAAKLHNLSADKLKTENGHVILPSGEKIAYGALAETAAKINPVKNVKLRDPSEWKFLGRDIQRTDIVAKSTGTQDYGIDMEMEGLVYATVRANPGIGGGVKSFDASDATKMRGVHKIMPVAHGVAVIADNSWRAFKAAEAINIEWEPGPYPPTSAQMWKILEKNLVPGSKAIKNRKDGNVDAALKSGDVIEAQYRVPYLAHAPLEPMNATVLITDERVDIWTGTQIPDFVQKHAVKMTGHKAKDVFVHVLPMGGSFGRRLEDTYVLQTLEIANSMRGTPVKMTWTREEDFSHDYVRPMALSRGRGTVKDGKVEAFDLDIVCQSIAKSQFVRLMGSAPPIPDTSITQGGDDQPYSIPNYRVTGYKAPEMAPVSSWRSVGASHNGFHHECFLDELIDAAGADPLKERIRLLQNDPLSVKVLEEVGRMSGWTGHKLGNGRGRGVAFTLSFGVRTAEIIEVVNTEAGIIIEKVWGAAEVGKVLDPINFEAQFSGGIVFALGHAMNCELTYEDYYPKQTNYYAYEGLKLYQTPDIQVKGLENGDQIKGMGEPGVPPAAPALANAIFAATGHRIRQLPLYKAIDFV
ncbi:MAG: xanthine dehydrogenase family protein molybdopterin-binding subunit [Hellea sp.]|nr:xanthine dehydrogenase family protein molybdopterin-binding subunit [Hellea sp.]